MAPIPSRQVTEGDEVLHLDCRPEAAAQETDNASVGELAMSATVRDVAKKAGVSAMTVSRVINGGVGVRSDTRRRVESAVAELDFVPNGIARGLMSRRTGTLGLIVPDIVNPFFAIVVRGAETVARRAGYRLLLCNSESDLVLERQYIEDVISHRVEGLLLAPVGDRSKANLVLAVRRKFPFVLIDRSVAGLTCDLVQADSVDGARKLVSHLISIGHRRIAVIIEPEDVDQVHDHPCAGRGKRAGWRLGELAHERTLDPRLARHGAALDHDDAPGDRPVVEGRANRREVCHQPCVVGFEAARAVKAEVFLVEVGIDLGLVFTGHFQFARANEAGDQLGTAELLGRAWAMRHGVRDPFRLTSLHLLHDCYRSIFC